MVYGDWLFFEIVLCRNAYKGSNPFLCARQQKGFRHFFGNPFFLPFLGCTIFSQVRKEREFCRFLTFEIVHDVRINFKGKRGRRMSYKLLTYIHVDTAFATPCYKRVPQFMQVVRAAKLFESLAYVVSRVREHSFGVLAFILRAFVRFRLFALSVKDCLYFVR